ELVRHLTTLRARLGQAISRRTARHADRLADFLRRRVLTDPGRPPRGWAGGAGDLGPRLPPAMTRHDPRARARLARAPHAVPPRSPRAVRGRGRSSPDSSKAGWRAECAGRPGGAGAPWRRWPRGSTA